MSTILHLLTVAVVIAAVPRSTSGQTRGPGAPFEDLLDPGMLEGAVREVTVLPCEPIQ